MTYYYRKHRATGNPVGRPRIIPHNLDELILEKLKRETNPATGLVSFSWKKLAAHFGVSRTTISRQMKTLKRLGRLETVYIPYAPNPKLVDAYYRLL